VIKPCLLDTSVVSALAPGRPRPSSDAEAWLRARDGELHLSTITVAEIEQGICKLRRARGVERAARLTEWLDRLLEAFDDRLIHVDAEIGRAAGRMSDAATAKGVNPGLADVLIAATARTRDLLLLTRNGRHFDALGVAHADPFVALPD